MTATNPIDALLAEKGVLLADGATGTNLFAMGLEAGEAPELLNETAPDTITSLHQNFVDAGADMVSIQATSAPPSFRPSICSAKASTASS